MSVTRIPNPERRARFRETFPKLASTIDRAAEHGVCYVDAQSTRRGESYLVTLYTIGAPLGEKHRRRAHFDARAIESTGTGLFNVSHDCGGTHGRILPFWPDAHSDVEVATSTRGIRERAIQWRADRRAFMIRPAPGASVAEALAELRDTFAAHFRRDFADVALYSLRMSS